MVRCGKGVDLKAAKQIREILQQPEELIDLARAKLTIDKLIDPTTDIEVNLHKIDAMVSEIKPISGFSTSQTAKLQALKRYIYEPGEWNHYQPYRYDLDDPLGTKISNKLLSHYITTKKGNCVTMPLLFVILGQRLGIDMTASTAPTHVFVKVKDEMTRVWYNLEATSGANPVRDAWLRQQLPMTDKAVDNGVYFLPLTKKETVAVITETLTERYVEQHEIEKIITVSDLILEYHPKDVAVMIRKANAYYDLLDKYYAQKYRSPSEIPPRAMGHYRYLAYNNKYWATKAMELGWREITKEEDERYLLSIKEAKRKMTNHGGTSNVVN